MALFFPRKTQYAHHTTQANTKRKNWTVHPIVAWASIIWSKVVCTWFWPKVFYIRSSEHNFWAKCICSISYGANDQCSIWKMNCLWEKKKELEQLVGHHRQSNRVTRDRNTTISYRTHKIKCTTWSINCNLQRRENVNFAFLLNYGVIWYALEY